MIVRSLLAPWCGASLPGHLHMRVCKPCLLWNPLCAVERWLLPVLVVRCLSINLSLAVTKGSALLVCAPAMKAQRVPLGP